MNLYALYRIVLFPVTLSGIGYPKPPRLLHFASLLVFS